MTQQIKFESHVRIFWSNTVDVILQRPGVELNSTRIGSFTTFGKIMSFVMRFFFGIEFEEVKLDGRVHYVRSKEWEELRHIASTRGNDEIKLLLDAAIDQIKGIVSLPPEILVPEPAPVTIESPQVELARIETSQPVPVKVESPRVEPARIETSQPVPVKVESPRVELARIETSQPVPVKLEPVNPNKFAVASTPLLPQPPIQQKIKVLSLCLGEIATKLSDLEVGVLGNEFQPIHNVQNDADAAICFKAYTERVTFAECEDSLINLGLSNTPTALIFFQVLEDFTRTSEPQNKYDNVDLFKTNRHRTFHVIGTERRCLNKSRWNDNQIRAIRQFLKEKALIKKAGNDPK